MDMKHSRKSGLTGRQKKQIRLVLLLLPFMIMIGIFSYAPLFGWSYAFVEFTPGVSIFKSQFVKQKRKKLLRKNRQKKNLSKKVLPKRVLSRFLQSRKLQVRRQQQKVCLVSLPQL